MQQSVLLCEQASALGIAGPTGHRSATVAHSNGWFSRRTSSLALLRIACICALAVTSTATQRLAYGVAVPRRPVYMRLLLAGVRFSTPLSG
jgi:hypothetical protein